MSAFATRAADEHDRYASILSFASSYVSARWSLRPELDIEDAAAQAVALLLSSERIRGAQIDRPEPWVATVAQRLLIDRHRRTSGGPDVSLDAPAGRADRPTGSVGDVCSDGIDRTVDVVLARARVRELQGEFEEFRRLVAGRHKPATVRVLELLIFSELTTAEIALLVADELPEARMSHSNVSKIAQRLRVLADERGDAFPHVRAMLGRTARSRPRAS